MEKRIKSFFITIVSFLAPAFFAITFMPEWADFLQYAHDKVASWGVPVVILALIGAFLGEVWKQVLNLRMIAKARENGIGSYGESYDKNSELYY